MVGFCCVVQEDRNSDGAEPPDDDEQRSADELEVHHWTSQAEQQQGQEDTLNAFSFLGDDATPAVGPLGMASDVGDAEDALTGRMRGLTVEEAPGAAAVSSSADEEEVEEEEKPAAATHGCEGGVNSTALREALSDILRPLSGGGGAAGAEEEAEEEASPSVLTCLQEFSVPEELTGDCAYECDECTRRAVKAWEQRLGEAARATKAAAAIPSAWGKGPGSAATATTAAAARVEPAEDAEGDTEANGAEAEAQQQVDEQEETLEPKPKAVHRDAVRTVEVRPGCPPPPSLCAGVWAFEVGESEPSQRVGATALVRDAPSRPQSACVCAQLSPASSQLEPAFFTRPTHPRTALSIAKSSPFRLVAFSAALLAAPGVRGAAGAHRAPEALPAEHARALLQDLHTRAIRAHAHRGGGITHTTRRRTWREQQEKQEGQQSRRAAGRLSCLELLFLERLLLLHGFLRRLLQWFQLADVAEVVFAGAPHHDYVRPCGGGEPSGHHERRALRGVRAAWHGAPRRRRPVGGREVVLRLRPHRQAGALRRGDEMRCVHALLHSPRG